MKRFIEGENRYQSTLFPERLDDYIADDNTYDARRNEYVCPAGEHLTYRFDSVESGRSVVYRSSGFFNDSA